MIPVLYTDDEMQTDIATGVENGFTLIEIFNNVYLYFQKLISGLSK